ncbi:hypothetical protein [Streptomyces sp. TRM68416]|uniref:hypothetical protein n=1 Tax=Streptomyces sp. TRM68416 TaxID=2758412 RepID=UPI001661C9A6|nr:hypothetical protein [Streptomyces sp. TRM68416]MBD0844250.1 hypothetical protein [Streptomyces sp. TRM68416]
MSAPDELPRLERAETHAKTVHRIYGDRRAAPPARELLLAVAYALFVAPGDPGRVLNTAARALGRSTATGRPRFDALVADDAPRYEPPRTAADWGPGQAPGCEAPRLRPYVYRPRRTATSGDAAAAVPLRPLPEPVVHVDPGYVPPVDVRNERQICGADSHHKVLELDPRTGWVLPHWFCKRHVDHAERVAEQVREQNAAAPEPIPNRGGLLPSYFKAPWEDVYRHYAPASWKPPTYGLSADDWPDPGNPPPARSPRRLRAV